MKNSFVKRLCVLLIILCMILPSIPVSAAYVTDVTSPVHLAMSGAETKILSEYTDTDKLREYLISELQQCKDTIDIAQFNIPESASSDLQLFIWREIPECFHVNTLGRYTGNPIPAIIVTYFYEKEEYLTMLSECKAVADKLLDGIKDNDELSDVLKALLIHDRLAVHNEYDYDFESGCYNMYASLVKRRSVCDGYTAAYLYLLRQVGIECVSCLSDKLNHSWVLVKLDGEYYHVDVTWDDPTWNVGERGVLGYAAHNNFLRSNTGIYQTNHNENDYYAPATSTKYDAYFWQSTNASFVLADDDIYYIDGTEQKLMKLNDDGVTGTPICSVEGIWSAPGGCIWTGNFSKLDTDGHRLFFTTADTVYMYDPATNKTKAVYKPELTGIEAIYGFDYSDGYLICDINTRPSGDVTELRQVKTLLTQYTVKFLDHDGTVLSERQYDYGDTVVVPANPTRQADETYTYAFKGWDKTVTTVNGDATYTAVYDETFIDYTVIFLDHDGSKISEKTYHYGADIDVPADPTREADETYTYTFKGWDKDVSATCNGSVTYTAVYDETFIDYTITFLDHDGSKISEKTYHFGADIDVPADPTRQADETYTYTFKGWDKDVSATCNGSVTYTAVYDKTEKAVRKPGDMNGDGRENNKDVVFLFRFVSRYDGSDFDTIYDFNGDGKVNNKDVVALFRYVSSAA